LNPKKSKNILKDLYSELDLDEALVADAIDFYWANVRKSITSISYTRIKIENLGDFQVKNKALTNIICKYEALINKFDKTNFSSYPRYQTLVDRLVVLEKTKKELDEESERRKKIKDQKHGNNTGSLEEKGTNP
jgi:hypothetical protein